VGELPELLSALDALNFALQERDGGAATRLAMEKLEQVTRRMTTPEVSDPELRQRLEKLSDAVLSRGGMGESFLNRLHSFAGLMDRLNEARQQFAQGPVDRLIDLAAQRGREQEPLRNHNGQVVMLAAKDVGERLREIQRDGLGDIQSRRRLWRSAVRLRFPRRRQSPTP
jgi:hypothetical protein